VVKSLKSHKLRTAVERLANWLLVTQGGGDQVVLPINKRTLATLLG
jgi:hypothetical protein